MVEGLGVGRDRRAHTVIQLILQRDEHLGQHVHEEQITQEHRLASADQVWEDDIGEECTNTSDGVNTLYISFMTALGTYEEDSGSFRGGY
jgi:hypothetical protein